MKANKRSKPLKIKIGAIEVPVSVEEIKEGHYGSFNPITGEIKLNKNLGKAQLRSTLLHEVLHACSSIASIEHIANISQAQEEIIVRCLENVLLQVIRDNPRLVKELTSE